MAGRHLHGLLRDAELLRGKQRAYAGVADEEFVGHFSIGGGTKA